MAKKKVKKTRTSGRTAEPQKPAGPFIESPTWGQVQRMAEVVLVALGGSKGAADKLSWESYYTLNLLSALKLDAKQSAAFVFGRQYIT